MLKKQRNLTEKCKKSFIGWKLPHTYVILTIILLVVVGLTYIIPGGEYDRVIDPANGKTIVLPDSFHFGEGNRPDFFDIFLSVSRGYVSAADILFLIVFAYGFIDGETYRIIDTCRNAVVWPAWINIGYI